MKKKYIYEIVNEITEIAYKLVTEKRLGYIKAIEEAEKILFEARKNKNGD